MPCLLWLGNPQRWWCEADDSIAAALVQSSLPRCHPMTDDCWLVWLSWLWMSLWMNKKLSSTCSCLWSLWEAPLWTWLLSSDAVMTMMTWVMTWAKVMTWWQWLVAEWMTEEDLGVSHSPPHPGWCHEHPPPWLLLPPWWCDGTTDLPPGWKFWSWCSWTGPPGNWSQGCCCQAQGLLPESLGCCCSGWHLCNTKHRGVWESFEQEAERACTSFKKAALKHTEDEDDDISLPTEFCPFPLFPSFLVTLCICCLSSKGGQLKLMHSADCFLHWHAWYFVTQRNNDLCHKIILWVGRS